jgi:hypothetical protein
MLARSRPLRQFCALAVLSVGVLVAPGAAQAATTTTLAWGCGGNGGGGCAVPAGLTNPIVIASGGDHGLAVKADGTVVAWGCGFNFGQCNVPGGLAGVTAVAASLGHSLAVKGDGSVVAWGCGSPFNRGQCTVPGGLAGVTAVAAGTYHSLALKSDGTVVAWGCVGADSGQCTVPVGLAGVATIAAGRTQSLALKSDGTVVAWGCGFLDFGQCNVPGGLAGVTAIAASYGHSLALKGNGTVVAWGCGAGHDFGQCNVPAALAGVTAIAAGDFHSLALAELIDQTITFGPIADRTWGDPGFIPSATASSGLPVSFSVSGACELIGGAVYAASGGSCTVTASQPGGLNFNPAPDVSRTFRIARVRQSIYAFAPLATKTFGDPDFVVSAFSSSDLPVSFAASGNCVVSGVIVHLTGAGSCTITASQAGNVNWEPAPDVSQTFSIERATQTIAQPPPARCRVPKVVGKRLVSAKRMIASSRCRTGKVGYAYSRKRKKGIVIAQSRRPGSVLPARSKINLIVSRGRSR